MTVLRVPQIVVLKPVHVHVERTIVVDVHVGNEEMYTVPSLPPFLDSYRILSWN
jgi:hypothetical protein